MANFRIIKARIKNGKIQRRKKVSDRKGYKILKGRAVRMTNIERKNRRLSARRAKIKRRGKLRQALRKRKISLRKRKRLGV